MIVGSLAIAGLVTWALTRTVEPATVASAPAVELQQPPVVTPAPASSTPSPTAMPNRTPLPLQTTTAIPPPFTPAAHDEHGETSGIRRVGPEELKALVDRAAVTVIDVRDSISYNQGHIPGAIHIPMARVEGEASRLPKGKPVVAYCT